MALPLVLISCGGSPEAYFNEGQEAFARWEKTEDITDYRLALKSLTQAAEMEPRNALYHYALGKAYGDAGYFADACPEMEKALAINPAFALAKEHLDLYRAEWKSDIEHGRSAQWRPEDGNASPSKTRN